MGSQSLTNFFNGDFDFEQLICWVHGHSHACSGISHIAGVPIINPGSLKEGKFAILELKCSKNRWYIASTTFHQLDDDETL
ncbi:hypothetical protein BC833DRAFT_605653 [Globomyces pollinis-pini]|nr:hypothetical protein BC833DRAFT_605653 [Globomyces pollinis-pini]